jgi:hypothetical protein
MADGASVLVVVDAGVGGGAAGAAGAHVVDGVGEVPELAAIAAGDAELGGGGGDVVAPPTGRRRGVKRPAPRAAAAEDEGKMLDGEGEVVDEELDEDGQPRSKKGAGGAKQRMCRVPGCGRVYNWASSLVAHEATHNVRGGVVHPACARACLRLRGVRGRAAFEFLQRNVARGFRADGCAPDDCTMLRPRRCVAHAVRAAGLARACAGVQ